MNGELAKKLLLRGGPPLIVVSLMLYYTYYVGNNAGKLYDAKDKKKTEQVEKTAVTETQPVQPEAAQPQETQPVQENPPADSAAQPSPVQESSFEQVFQDEAWRERTLADWSRLFLTFADEVGNGCIPLKSCGALRSNAAFTADEQGGEWRVSAQSAARYSRYVDLLCGIDAPRAVSFFLGRRKALDAMLAEMGFVGLDSLALARQALATFRDLPVPEEEPLLYKAEGRLFTWKDQELEKLSPVRKMCLRMGLDNARRIQAKAAELSAQLEEQLAKGRAD